MKWRFSDLQNYTDEVKNFTETLDVKDRLVTDFGDVIKEVTPVELNGFIQADRDDVIVHATVNVTVTTPSTRSLELVDVPLTFDIDEVYIQDTTHMDRYEEEQSVMVVDKEIDFKEAVIEYIVVNIPLQVLTEEEAQGQEMPTGNDWAVLSEKDYENQADDAESNTPLAGLADLFAATDDK